METTSSAENSVPHGSRKIEEPSASRQLPPTMTDARFLQQLMLATPLYFYYHNLVPPGYFSNLLKAFVQLHKAEQSNDEASNTPVAGASSSISSISKQQPSSELQRASKRKLITTEAVMPKTKRLRPSKEDPFPYPRMTLSPESSHSPWQRKRHVEQSLNHQ